ncbi:uncharacterized protein I303_101811 [Kwoniella dejecticola CBS 10117]|uniref:Uncharacterized protein n=1 Tax=Kwoniella dejecticola CBS 10117 TaxID=1296121 RepID=A0A1A6ACQ8_9TREE|nr:uncharacterized protein I303_02054 [Kwoniella dejecticola CBS 10117]OBR87840.1 hypothetical protein I303_02054 [Kwoniella dejecticola CBS 10117]
MQALRTLPILNRPSRPSSPAPPTVQSTTASGTSTVVNGDGKPRSRSLSRQVAEKVSSLHAANNGAAPAAAIAPSQPVGAPKKGMSPPGSRPVTPRSSASPLPGVAAPNGTTTESAGIQAKHMDVIGLRLNEVVNKACAGVDFKAKKGFKKGNGWSVGEAVVKELPFPPSDAYLIRAVLRTSVKALSIYTIRLETLLLPALTDPAFANALNINAQAPAAHPLNPTQYFVLSVAHAAWETCEVLEQTLETGKWPRFVQETLRPVMDKLDLVVSKVIQPLMLGLKRDLIASLSRNEGTSPTGSKVVGLASIPAPTTAPTPAVTKEHSNAPVSRLTKELSSGGTSRQLAIPPCLQHFANRVDGSRKIFDLVAAPCADDGEGWITGVMVTVIWKGMCIVSEKDLGGATNRPPSPNSVAKALAGLGKEKETTPTVVASPSLGGVTAKLTSSLSIIPSRSQSRPPSPPRGAQKVHPATHALMSLEGLVKRLVGGLVQPPAAPGASINQDPNATEHIAREALHEALEALASFRIISNAMYKGASCSSRLLASTRRLRDDIDDPVEESLDDAMEDLPAVTLFTILQRQANLALAGLPANDEKAGTGHLKIRTPAEIWGWTLIEYERQVLSGFSAAEEWGRRYATAIKPDLERVLGQLATQSAGFSEKPTREVIEAVEWVKALGVACEARVGIKMGGCA